MNSENGVSFLIAEQNANLAMKYADYCYILENGVVVIGDEAVNLSARDDIKEYYLGSH
jgi:branched-chain amino acid transport system ATP-binding protein